MAIHGTLYGLQIVRVFFFFLHFNRWILDVCLRFDLLCTVWWRIIQWGSRMKYLWVTASWLTCWRESFSHLLKRYYVPYISYLHLTLFLSAIDTNCLCKTVYLLLFTSHSISHPFHRSALHAWTDKSCSAKAGKCVQQASYHYRRKNIWLLKSLSICCQCEPKFFGMHCGIHRPWRQFQEGAVWLDFIGFHPWDINMSQIIVWLKTGR